MDPRFNFENTNQFLPIESNVSLYNLDFENSKLYFYFNDSLTENHLSQIYTYFTDDYEKIFSSALNYITGQAELWSAFNCIVVNVNVENSITGDELYTMICADINNYLSIYHIQNVQEAYSEINETTTTAYETPKVVIHAPTNNIESDVPEGVEVNNNSEIIILELNGENIKKEVSEWEKKISTTEIRDLKPGNPFDPKEKCFVEQGDLIDMIKRVSYHKNQNKNKSFFKIEFNDKMAGEDIYRIGDKLKKPGKDNKLFKRIFSEDVYKQFTGHTQNSSAHHYIRLLVCLDEKMKTDQIQQLFARILTEIGKYDVELRKFKTDVALRKSKKKPTLMQTVVESPIHPPMMLMPPFVFFPPVKKMQQQYDPAFLADFRNQFSNSIGFFQPINSLPPTTNKKARVEKNNSDNKPTTAPKSDTHPIDLDNLLEEERKKRPK